jgi:regulator of protease activity HflC (stomatin/prohibitin superfamily)
VGVKVSTVEIKDAEIPADMQRAMARQAEAERERRAKIINAEASSRPPKSWPAPRTC